jgi:protein-L-isoaspartate(D-aspartate) O-methyltransferase
MDFADKKAKLIEHLKGHIKDERVLSALRRVPRECFVPGQYEPAAYNNEPLPIGCHQTISQPLIIGIMTEALELNGNEKVLEIGTGSGYQTAILAELAREVITIERIPSLMETAAKMLQAMGYSNIKMHLSRNNLGWEPEAPYDAILVTAGAPRIPTGLVSQLAIGGRLVIPVGPLHLQELYQITRLEDRNVNRCLGGCQFVPLIGKEAWEEE